MNKSLLASIGAGAMSALIVSLLVVNFADKAVKVSEAGEVLEQGTLQVVRQEDQVIKVVENSTPAVVSVVITKDVPVIEQYYEDFGGPFGGFGFQIPRYRENGTEEKQVGGGSGFVVSEDGFIVTNKHVVSDEDAEYTVFLDDGSEYEAEVVARDPLNDIAVLKIDADNLDYLEFADSDTLKVGQTAIAIGNPLLEFSNSVSVGVVSGLSRSIVAGDRVGGSTEELDGVIQTDAAINPGNSGGPLIDLSGKVIGVNVAVASAENIGFSLPANAVKAAYESVKEYGEIRRAFLGVRYMPITEEVVKANNLKVDYGVLVIRGESPEQLAVVPGSPADKAGLRENDIILEIDGQKLEGDVSLARVVAGKAIGDKLELTVLSQGKEKKITVELEELEQ